MWGEVPDVINQIKFDVNRFQWRIKDFCEGDAAGSGGGAPSGDLGAEPQRVPGAESLVGDSGGAKPAEKLSTFCDTTNNLIWNLVARA